MRRHPTIRTAVIDTNLLVSGLLLKRGYPYQLIEALRQSLFRLVVSDPLREEYQRVLHRPSFQSTYGLRREEVTELLGVIDATAQHVDVIPVLPVAVRDPKDAMVLATAIGGEADYLVTGDQDLLVLHEHPELLIVHILTPRAFVELL